MQETTRTTTALLEGLGDPANALVWETFDRRYRPLLFALARRMGVAEPDAADIAQDAIVQFASEYREGRYDRSRGRLRNWLLAFVRFRVVEFYRRRARRAEHAGGDPLDAIADEASLSDAWDQERKLLLLREALEELRNGTRTDPRTIRAFELLYVHGLTPSAASTELGVSTDEVYVARSRIAARVREIVRRLDQRWDD